MCLVKQNTRRKKIKSKLTIKKQGVTKLGDILKETSRGNSRQKPPTKSSVNSNNLAPRILNRGKKFRNLFNSKNVNHNSL
jgi:hypothetical protein